MPLLDHFHPPLAPLHSWESFHSRWANAIADALDRTLPGRFFAEVQVHWGTQVEADVAEFEWAAAHEGANGAGGSVAVQTWAPPVAVQTLPLVFPDEVEVQVFDLRNGGKRLAAVIELISPGNKDSPETRRAFAAKCVAYLHRGVGLINVDVVTRLHANLHNEVLEMLGQGQAALPPEVRLYAVAYVPARRADANQLDLWPMPLAVGQPLPLLPLALRGAFFVPVDLEATYTETRQRRRL
jgi:hypothetical protein